MAGVDSEEHQYTIETGSNPKLLVETEVDKGPFVLALTKSDVQVEWQITRSEIPDWCHEAIVVIETSAKDNTGVETVFQNLADALVPEKYPICEPIARNGAR